MVISFHRRLRRGERVLLGMMAQWRLFNFIDEMYEYGI